MLKRTVQCEELQHLGTRATGRLPRGLVGSRCTADIRVMGHNCRCLLDTGLQVTTVPVSFFNRHLHDQLIHPLHDLLHIEGAAGQSVPCLGYIDLAVTFPKDFLGRDTEVSTLALVVPDSSPDSSSTILIGMNTLEPLYEQYMCKEAFQPSTPGYRTVLKTLQLTHQQRDTGGVGVVRLFSKVPVRVPAGRTLVIEGTAKVASFPAASQSILLHHPGLALPGGLCVSSCLVSILAYAPYKVPVIVTNKSEQDAYIPPLSVIAELRPTTASCPSIM